MDLMASLRALRRQWILTAFLLLLTFAAAVATWVKLPGPYSSVSMVTLVPSQQASKLNGNNPYMSYGGSENVAGDIILRQTMDPATVVALAQRGYTGSFTIADDPNTSGPILDITVTGSSKAVVQNTLRGVTKEVQLKLAALQQNLLPANRITSIVVSFQNNAKLEVSKKARDIVLVVGLGLVLTYAIPQIVDGQLRRRRGDDDSDSPPPAAVSGYGPPAEEDQYGQSPYQAPHRRRYRPTIEPEPEPVPDSRPAARPSAERPRGVERAAAPAPASADSHATSGARRSSGSAGMPPEGAPSPTQGSRNRTSGVAVYPRMPEPPSDNEGRHLRDRDRYGRDR
jgi:hypothetical protein